MEIALSGLQWQTCLIYIDDIIVYEKDFKEHLERAEAVLARIKDAGLKLKPEKCELLRKEVAFLGHVINENGIKPNQDNVNKILTCPEPRNATEVRQFLGMGSYYRRFIKNFSNLTKPLVSLTKKNTTFLWDEKCQESFRDLSVLK
jgi:hypothetical protein